RQVNRVVPPIPFRLDRGVHLDGDDQQALGKFRHGALLPAPRMCITRHLRGRWATMAREETFHMRLPLEDVTVIDLSHALAGPFCSTMLADFGARVIKLEPKGAGDIARAWGSPLPGGETAYFVSLHRNKQ